MNGGYQHIALSVHCELMPCTTLVKLGFGSNRCSFADALMVHPLMKSAMAVVAAQKAAEQDGLFLSWQHCCSANDPLPAIQRTAMPPRGRYSPITCALKPILMDDTAAFSESFCSCQSMSCSTLYSILMPCSHWLLKTPIEHQIKLIRAPRGKKVADIYC